MLLCSFQKGGLLTLLDTTFSGLDVCFRQGMTLVKNLLEISVDHLISRQYEDKCNINNLVT